MLQAKLCPPFGNHALIDRPQLTGLVARLTEMKVVLVRAPMGYGKTSLLVQWMQGLVCQRRAVGWLTLDEGDNDPDRLALHIGAALSAQREPVASSPGPHGATQSFANRRPSVEEAARAGPIILFLDEFEHLHSEPAEGLVSRMIETSSPGSCFVISSRVMPRLPLAALREQGLLMEMGLDDLRFSEDDADAFLRSREAAMERGSLAKVVQQTEGWIAGLQLFALASARNRDPGRLIHNVSGSRCEIANLLTEEVFARQNPQVQLFLLRTSILDRMCASLCDAVTGRRDSEELLDKLELAGLFLLPCDRERRWFRYHPLFAQLLRERFARREGVNVPSLHRAAADWFAARGLAYDAAHHGFAANDLEFAADIVDRWAMETFRQGQLSTVTRWAEKLPAELLDNHPSIREASAWAHTCLRNFREARRQIEEIRRLADEAELDSALLDGVACLEAVIFLFQGRDAEALEVCKDNLLSLRNADPFRIGALQTVYAFELITSGRFNDARETLTEACLNQERAGSALGIVYAKCLKGLCEAVQGNLRAADASYRDAKSLASPTEGTRSYLPAVLSAYYAELLYERNELDEAESLLLPSFRSMSESALPDMVTCGYLTYARIQVARGNPAKAIYVLEEAEVHGFRTGWSRLVVAARWERLRIALAQDALREAISLHDWIREASGDTDPRGFYLHATETEVRDIGEVRFRIRCGNARGALAIVRSELARAQSEGRGWRTLRLKVFEAQALEATGARSAALVALGEALRYGAREMFVRSIADEGRALAPLLQHFASRASDPVSVNDFPQSYLDRILIASGQAGTLATSPATTVTTEPTPSDPLSDREREILCLLAEGLSNEELAKHLSLSGNTVKWHLRNIYDKLHVDRRARAIAVARHQGLVFCSQSSMN